MDDALVEEHAAWVRERLAARAINPARDLAPRIVHAMLPIRGKGDSDWSYAWVPVVGPMIGGAAAGLLYNVLFRWHL